MRIRTVITADGEKFTWWGTWQNVLFRRFPQVGKDGFVWLDGFPYVHDAARDVRESYRPKRYLGLLVKEDQFSYWRQNEPDQVNLADVSLTPGSVGITGDTISQYAQSQHLRRLISEGPNWYAIIALFAVVALIGSIVALYYKKG